MEKIPEQSKNKLEISEKEIKLFLKFSLSYKGEHAEAGVGGLKFEIFPSPSVNDSGEVNGYPGEAHAVEKNKWDIYIWDDLSINVQRAILFHELLEAKFISKQQEEKAHSLAALHDEFFLSVIKLNDDELKIYTDLKDKYSF